MLNHEHAPFWIGASNIVTQENDVFGPFGGPAILTYESLRGRPTTDNEDDFPETLFLFVDPGDPGQLIQNDPDRPEEGMVNEHGYDFWESNGEIRYHGWRQVKQVITRRHPDGRPYLQHDEPFGPFYTDIVIHTEPLT